MGEAESALLITADTPLKKALAYLNAARRSAISGAPSRCSAKVDVGPETKVAELGCSAHETLILLQKMGVTDITVADL